jgi:hypothetical protein
VPGQAAVIVLQLSPRQRAEFQCQSVL